MATPVPGIYLAAPIKGPLLPSLYPIHHTRIIDKFPVERLRFVRVTRI